MVMAALLLFKAIKAACAAEDQWRVQKTGMPHGWDVAFYLFGLFKAVLFFFTVIVLIRTGWSFLKPFLREREREKRILMTIIPLQVIGNITRLIINEAGFVMDDWLTWTQWIELVLDCVDVVCFASVFVLNLYVYIVDEEEEAAAEVLRNTNLED
ncbi:uncharacterized protein A4U43_C07F3360 [Asparagus officinalis]|uniref:GOST seven transmembrane domain-containing protein n=1 Tax=Asparagus officinalis TaxID=4686 RepID=A0A5P1E954_ASPOF|nr:uncharacterized protein A4U43_C07F3360 [Asparagus officinalis]